MALIVDDQGRRLREVDAAVARRLLREGYGKVVAAEPYTIRLRTGLTDLPSLHWRAEGVYDTRPGDAMNQPRSPGILNNSSWVNLFQDGDDVWVQNLGDQFISMDIEVGNGDTRHVRLPRMREPYRISDEVAFVHLKSSNAFRRALAKRVRGAPEMRVLTTQQAEEYLATKARNEGVLLPGTNQPDIEAVYQRSLQRYRDLTTVPTSEQGPGGFDVNGTFAPPKSAMELIAADMQGRGYNAADPNARDPAAGANLGRRDVLINEVVHPRVLHLCQQVGSDLQPHELLPAPAFLEELAALDGDFNPRTRTIGQLSEDSLQHLVAHGRYKTVKTWASQRLSRLSAATEIDDTASVASAAPPAQGYGPPPNAPAYYQQPPAQNVYGAPTPAAAPPPYAGPMGPTGPYGGQSPWQSAPGGGGVGMPGFAQRGGQQAFAAGDRGIMPTNLDPAANFQGPRGFANAPPALREAGMAPAEGGLVGPSGQPVSSTDQG